MAGVNHSFSVDTSPKVAKTHRLFVRHSCCRSANLIVSFTNSFTARFTNSRTVEFTSTFTIRFAKESSTQQFIHAPWPHPFTIRFTIHFTIHFTIRFTVRFTFNFPRRLTVAGRLLSATAAFTQRGIAPLAELTAWNTRPLFRRFAHGSWQGADLACTEKKPPLS
jgi:hypothetical protein